MKPLEKEHDYYLSSHKDLVRDYEGKVIVIVGEEVVGVYLDELEAYTEESKKRKPGTFLIQHCSLDTSPQMFRSRVSFD